MEMGTARFMVVRYCCLLFFFFLFASTPYNGDLNFGIVEFLFCILCRRVFRLFFFCIFVVVF